MPSFPEALFRLREIVGDAHLITDTATLAEYAVEGQVPAAVALPANSEETAALLKAAAEAGMPVLVRGAGSHLYLGAPPGPVGLVVSLARLSQVVAYEPDDLTLTAQAGITLAAVAEAVSERRQILPLDPPGPAAATLGGVVAAGLAGPMRMKYGAPRDLVLGMRVALATGEVIRVGGRTVKNVAGSDLTRLFVGSLGSLGAITELTIRLAPAPQEQAVALAPLSLEEMSEVVGRLTSSPWELVACEVLTSGAAARLRPYLPSWAASAWGAICVGLGGSSETVERQQERVASLLGSRVIFFRGDDVGRIWERLRQPLWPASSEQVLVRGSVPPGRLAELLSGALPRGWAALAHAADGIVYAWPPSPPPAAPVGPSVAALREACGALGGHCVLESAPVDLKRELGVWGPSLPNADLMARIKAALDPAGVLGCGRFW